MMFGKESTTPKKSFYELGEGRIKSVGEVGYFLTRLADPQTLFSHSNSSYGWKYETDERLQVFSAHYYQCCKLLR